MFAFVSKRDENDNVPNGTLANVSVEFGVKHSTLQGWIKDFDEGVDLSFDGRKSNRRPLKFDAADRIAIVEYVRSNPFETWKSVAAWYQVQKGGQVAISKFSLRQICRNANPPLYRRIERMRKFLTSDHRLERQAWCQIRRTWGDHHWASKIFSDEKGVTPNGSVVSWVSRPNGTREDPLYARNELQTSFRVNFYGYVTSAGLGDLFIFPGRGTGEAILTAITENWSTMSGRLDELPFGAKIIYHDGPNFYKQPSVQNGLAALAAQRQPQDTSFQVFPPIFPDGNIIENVWNVLEKRLQPKFHVFFHENGRRVNRAECVERILETWEEMRLMPDLVPNLYASLPRRMAYIADHEGHFCKY